MKLAYGGVVFNAKGEVLLREVANHWDDYVWTFAKGRPETGETPETAALREVHEETGFIGKIVRRVPGEFLGGTTRNIYFVMSPVEDTGEFDPEETQAIKWVKPDEARRLLAKTINYPGRKRDLAVLEAALKEWQESQQGRSAPR